MTHHPQSDGDGHPCGDVTRLLHQARSGDAGALDRLMPLVYGELRRQAARQLRRERADHTLQPTALVHETYLRLLENRRIQWHDRAHFFAVSARLMRRILVDQARARGAQKRGRDGTHVALGGAELPADREPTVVDILMLDDTLKRLEALDARRAQVVEMRVFAGLSVDETAAALGVSPRTIKSDWRFARAWLTRELRAFD